MNPGAVSLKTVSKTYGAVQAVQTASLEILPGEFFTLLGASGSGKTSLLRLIGGFELANSGQIWVGGTDVTQLPPYRRPVHTVFQDYALFPHLSVFENVGFPLRVLRRPESEIQTQVRSALELVQLAEYCDRTPDQLSGGQQQRIALARAIVDRPQVLLLDEPLSALDAQIRIDLRAELKQLQRQTGITFVYVTHDQEEALALSDRIAVMGQGQLLQVGTPLEIYEHPVNLYVAQFIGRANFLNGTLVDQQANLGKVQIGDALVIGTVTTDLPLNSPVTLMVRPENVALQDAPASDPPGAPSSDRVATIQQSQYLGYATSYLLEWRGQGFEALELRRRGSTPLAEGTPVSLAWDGSEALIFPAAD